MMTCEACEKSVPLVLRHREYSRTMTHRVTSWLCRNCHPTAPTTDGAGTETSRVVTDGGTAAVCPQCASSTVNVQGVYDCVTCEWNSY